MGNKCMRPAFALDDAPPGVEAVTFFALRYPEKYRLVCELEQAVTILSAVATDEDLKCISYRSVLNRLENQMMHLKKLSCLTGRIASPRYQRKCNFILKW